MEYVLMPLLVLIALFLVFCWILRWMLGTDKLIEHARRQTKLLEKIAGQADRKGRPSSGNESLPDHTVYEINGEQ